MSCFVSDSESVCGFAADAMEGCSWMQLAEAWRKWHSDTCTGDRGDVQQTLVTCVIRLVIDKTIIFNIPLHYSGLILFTLFVLGILMLIVVLISFFRFLRAYSWKNAVALSPFSPSCFDNGHQERNSPMGGSGC